MVIIVKNQYVDSFGAAQSLIGTRVSLGAAQNLIGSSPEPNWEQPRASLADWEQPSASLEAAQSLMLGSHLIFQQREI